MKYWALGFALLVSVIAVPLFGLGAIGDATRGHIGQATLGACAAAFNAFAAGVTFATLVALLKPRIVAKGS